MYSRGEAKTFDIDFSPPEPGSTEYLYDAFQTIIVVYAPDFRQDVFVRATKPDCDDKEIDFYPSEILLRTKLLEEPTDSVWVFTLKSARQIEIKRRTRRLERERAEREARVKAAAAIAAKVEEKEREISPDEPLVPYSQRTYAFNVSTNDDARRINRENES